jgi:hypothetical protein
MNGDLKPEILNPKVENVNNVGFESGREKAIAKAEQIVTSVSENVSTINPIIQAHQKTAVYSQADQQIVLEKVEKILAEDMDNIFLSLDVRQQADFKKRGEEVSRKIVKILEKSSISFNKIVNLIISWLRIIPHVNKFYLEQEAKIKTDRIMLLNKK